MLVWLANYLSQYYHAFQVVNYLTLRAVFGVLTALFIAFAIGPYMIRYLKRYNVGQPIRELGPESHFSKQGTPTMGGTLIVISVALSTLLWVNLANRFYWFVLLVLLGFGLVGFVDDYRKVIQKNHHGLSAKAKFFWQSAIGLLAASLLFYTANTPVETQLIVPFFKDVGINLGIFYIFLTYCVIVGSSNAVNLTDGLDGLAILPCVLIAAALGIFSYASGNIVIAEYLGIPYIAGVGEIVVVCAAIAGSGLGFLWFNTYPAQVFMGDVGALALGATLGIIAVLVRQEIVFFVMAGVFVLETVSVILQVSYFKLTKGRRIFLMAPLHHHYELKGWPEPRVIVRFWIITVILVLVGLATLKLR